MNRAKGYTSHLKIAVLSLADINNYGDMFFPYIFRLELQSRLPTAKIDLYTNMQYHCDIYDTAEYSRNRLLDYNAVILAGGDTVQRLDEENWKDIYPSDIGKKRPSDIIFDWLDLDKPYKAYFSVGVHPQMQEYRQDVLSAISRLDYLAVRGVLSKKILEGAIISNNNKIRIVPDLGWLFNRYIDVLEKETEGFCVPSKPYMVFEIFYEFDEEVLRFAARTLQQFQSETGVEVMLLPIVHTKSRKQLSTWNDYYPLSRIAEYTDNALTLMPDQLSAAEVGILLKNAKFYLGSSMHGALTCLSYGKPAGNILTWTAPKLQELHGARTRADCFINHWGRLPEFLRKLDKEAEEKNEKKYSIMYADYMWYRLSTELDELCRQICEKQRIGFYE